MITGIEWHGVRDVIMSLELDMNLSSEAGIINYLNCRHMYEAEVCHVMERAVRLGDTVLDVGANIGFFSNFLSRLVGPNGVVVAFEPGGNALGRLGTNLTLNNAANVRVVTDPVSNSIQDIVFYLSGDDAGGNALWNHAIYQPDNKNPPTAVPMRSTTIMHVYQKQRLAIPRLIKLDIEGAEHRAVMGMENLLGHVPYIISEVSGFLDNLGSSWPRFRSYMRGWGYDMWLLYPDGQTPKMLPPKTAIDSNGKIINVLFATADAVGALWNTEKHDPDLLYNPTGTYQSV